MPAVCVSVSRGDGVNTLKYAGLEQRAGDGVEISLAALLEGVVRRLRPHRADALEVSFAVGFSFRVPSPGRAIRLGLVRIVHVEHRFRELGARCERLAGVEGTDSDDREAYASLLERWERIASQLHGTLPAEHSAKMSQELDDDALVTLPRRRELDRPSVGDGQHGRAGQPLVSRQRIAGAQRCREDDAGAIHHYTADAVCSSEILTRLE